MNVDAANPTFLFIVAGIIVVLLVLVPKLHPIYKAIYNKGKSVQADREAVTKVEQRLDQHLKDCKETNKEFRSQMSSLQKEIVKLTAVMETRQTSADSNHAQLIGVLESLRPALEKGES